MRQITLWAFVSFVVNLGFSRFSYGVVLPALHGEFALSYGALGIVNAINLAGYLIGTLAAPPIAGDPRRCERGFAVSTLLVGIGLAGSASAHGVADLAAWRLLVGIASAVAVATTSVLTFARVVPGRRGRASSAMWAGLAFGLAVSGPCAPFVNAAQPPFSWRAMWFAMALCAPIAAAGFLRAVRAHAPKAASAPSAGGFAWGDLVHPRRLLFVNLAYFMFGVAYIAYATFAVALFRAHGIAAAGVGLAWALVGLSGVAGSLLAGRLLDSGARGIVLFAAFASAGVGALVGTAPSIGAALASAIVFGAGITAIPAIVTAVARIRTTAATYPVAFSAVTTMLALGQFVGPVAVAPFVDRSGLGAAASFSAAAFAAGAAFAALDRRFATSVAG